VSEKERPTFTEGELEAANGELQHALQKDVKPSPQISPSILSTTIRRLRVLETFPPFFFVSFLLSKLLQLSNLSI